MMKVTSRADLHAIQGKKAPVPVAPAANPAPGIEALARAVQEGAMQTQRSMLVLAEAVARAQPMPRPRTLVADVERDELGRMSRVIISVED